MTGQPRQITAVDIIGVPLDMGVKELGLKLGPDGFRETGLVGIAAGLGLDVRDCGNIALPPGAAEVRGNEAGRLDLVATFCRALAEKTAESIRAGRVPVCLGGDHSLTIGSLAGVASQLERVGCVWIDTHPDANTPESSPTGNIHGMPVAVLLGHGPGRLVNLCSSGPVLRYQDICLIGTHDMDPGEVQFLHDHGVVMYSAFDILEQGLAGAVDQAIDRLRGAADDVHVSLDLDVLHADIAPGVGLPANCGMVMREAVYLCRRLASELNIVSIDLVGLNPVHDRAQRTARAGIELLFELLGYRFSFMYHDYLQDQKTPDSVL